MAQYLNSNIIAITKKAKDGNSVESIVVKYGLSSDLTQPTTWYDTPPAVNSENKYLWSYEITTFSDGTDTETKPKIIGTYADDGVSFTIRILSSNGNTFRMSQSVETTLTVQVLRNNDDITDSMEDYRFNWKRKTGNDEADTSWNNSSKAICNKSVHITKDDCLGRTVFECEVNLDNL